MCRKIPRGAIVFVLVLMSILSVGYAVGEKAPLTVLSKFTEAERQKMSSQADLIFEGAFSDVEMLNGKVKVQALARGPSHYRSQEEMVAELPWVITFDVENVIKGTYREAKFSILVRNPSAQFGIAPSDSKASKGKKFRIYTHIAQTGRTLIGQELM